MAEDTPFRVQSLTKSITAWAVLKLVEQGELELDDPVGRHLTSWERPDAAYSWDDVTVRRLLAHSAGLPAGGYESVPLDEEPPPLREALSGHADGPAARPTSEPGEFRYSNIGYALLELLLEDVTGRDFTAYVADEILEPLEMESATFVATEGLRSELATEHFVDGSQAPRNIVPPAPTAGCTQLRQTSLASSPLARRRAGNRWGGRPRTGARRGTIRSDCRNDGLLRPRQRRRGARTLRRNALRWGAGSDERRARIRFVALVSRCPRTGDGIVILTNSERSVQLIADVVAAWTDRRGLPSQSLTRARSWIRLPVWILVGVAAGLALRLGYGAIAGTRTFARYPTATASLERSWASSQS